MRKMLVVFYSWSNGNTEGIAKMLQKATGADIAQIETAVPYIGSHDDVVRQGQFNSNGGDHLETQETEIKAWAQKVKALLQ